MYISNSSPNRVYKKFILVILIYMTGWSGSLIQANGQSALHISMKQQLTNLKKQSKDDKFIHSVTEVMALYTTDTISVPLACKLLIVDSFVLHNPELVQQTILSFAETLAFILDNMPPRGENYKYATALNYLAIQYRSMSQYHKALPLFQKLLTIIKNKSEDDPLYANCMNNLAILYGELGLYEKALSSIENALRVRKKLLGEAHFEFLGSLFNMAVLYSAMGEHTKAKEEYNRIASISNKAYSYNITPDPSSLIQMLGYRIGRKNLSDFFSTERIGNLYDGIVNALSDLPGEKPGQESMKKDAAFLRTARLAIIYREMMKGALLIQQSVLVKNGEIVFRNEGNIQELKKIFEDFDSDKNNKVLFRELQKALTIRIKILGIEHPDNVASLNDLGFFSMLTGNYTAGAGLMSSASNILLQHMTRNFSSLSEQEKIILLKKNSFQFSFLASFLLNPATAHPAIIQQVHTNELALKGMVLQHQGLVLRSIRKSGDSAALHLYEQWLSNKAFINKQIFLPLDNRLSYFDSLQKATNLQEQELSQRSAAFENFQSNVYVTTKNISQKIRKGQAVIEFLRFDFFNKRWKDSTIYGALILLPGDDNPKYITLFEEKQLKYLLTPWEAVNADTVIKKLYPGMVSRGGVIQGKQPARLHDSIYHLIWKPLEKHLTGVQSVYYAPAGLLHRIAFQALKSDSSNLLIDKFQLIQSFSNRSVVLPAIIDPKPASVSIWGDIEYDLLLANKAGRKADASHGDIDTTASSFNDLTIDTRPFRGGAWQSLKGTKEEMNNLKKEFAGLGVNVGMMSGTGATEEAFKGLSGKSPKVLHLATHGFFLPVEEIKPGKGLDTTNILALHHYPMFRCGLVLAGANHAWNWGAAVPDREDGILTAYEIAQMDLSNTDLVVLSACETALGDLQGNEGVIGLQRAFKMAGVKQMILSLWKVPDKETSELMTEFYKNWIGGQSTRESLRSAQLKMKKKYPPYYWAAFVLME